MLTRLPVVFTMMAELYQYTMNYVGLCCATAPIFFKLTNYLQQHDIEYRTLSIDFDSILLVTSAVVFTMMAELF